MNLLINIFIDLINILKYIFSNPIYLITMIILNIILRKYYPQLRGYFGERWIRKELNKLPKEEYITLNNIMLMNNNTTHQIDHIVISKYGIFVIETKNYYGLIIGKEYSKKWIQYLGKKKSPFTNPIHQNYGHIKALEELLNLNNNIFISIICFSNQAKLKVESKTIITQTDYICSKIKEYNNIILNENIFDIANKINNKNIKDKKIRKYHIKTIKEKERINNEKIKNMICPKCGGKLVPRKSEYGEFLGCSNYPNCNFKTDINK